MPETDVLASVSLAARVLNAGTAENKQLIILHSGVSTAATLPMEVLILSTRILWLSLIDWKRLP